MGKISMKKVSEILRQRYELNRSYRDIARSLNISMSGCVAINLGCIRTPSKTLNCSSRLIDRT